MLFGEIWIKEDRLVKRIEWQVEGEEEGEEDLELTFVIVWDNVAFYHSAAVINWFAALPRMSVLFLSPYSPFLNPIEEFFSVWRWKVYNHSLHKQLSLLDAMNAGCGDISPEVC